MGGHNDQQRNQNEGPNLHRERIESRRCEFSAVDAMTAVPCNTINT